MNECALSALHAQMCTVLPTVCAYSYSYVVNNEHELVDISLLFQATGSERLLLSLDGQAYVP
jgi:hypothetical protein